jgi:hypothetical protein
VTADEADLRARLIRLRRLHFAGNRVRVLDEPLTDAAPYGPPADQIRRGVVTDVRTVPGADPPDYRYTVRLDAGGEVSDVPGELLDDEHAAAPIVRRLSPRWMGTAWSASTALVEKIADAARRDQWNRTHPPAEHHGKWDDPPVPSPTVDDLLDALALMGDYRQRVDETERALMAEARARGATWDQIGLVLGYKPGAARQSATALFTRRGGDPKRAVPLPPAAATTEAPETEGADT